MCRLLLFMNPFGPGIYFFPSYHLTNYFNPMCHSIGFLIEI